MTSNWLPSSGVCIGSFSAARKALTKSSASAESATKRGAQSLGPPREVLFGERVPVIERIAPQLAVGGEIIRWHASHSLSLAINT